MTQKQVQSLIRKIFDKVQQIRGEGQKEYARKEDNAFANFERIGSWLDKSKEEVLMIYLMKHIDGIISWVDGHRSQREDVTGRIIDCIVYLCLLYGMSEKAPVMDFPKPKLPDYQCMGDEVI